MADNRYTSKERLYLNSKGEVVKANDPDRQSLLVGAGGTLSMEDAERYGLTGGKNVAAAEAAQFERKPGPNDPAVAADMAEDGSADETADGGRTAQRQADTKAKRGGSENK